MALGFDNCYACALGRKRVVISKKLEASNPINSPLKRVFSDSFTSISESSRLEDLHLDLLLKVICGVNHEDLEQLFLVSSTIREAAEIAKELHFDFTTPKNKTFSTLHNHIDVDGATGFEEIEAPHAPLKKSRSRSINSKILDSVSANLFPSMDEEIDEVH